MSTPAHQTAPFGAVFTDKMALSRWDGEQFEQPHLEPVGPLPIHPAAHVLHYSSSVFEGLKAHRGTNGELRLFRLDRHIERMQDSARLLCLPPPDGPLLEQMVIDVVHAARDVIPKPPGSLYLRPTLIGTEANVGAAAAPSKEALLYVLASPVGDYFSGGVRPLKVVVEEHRPRSTPTFGMAKTGANYAAALGLIMEAKHTHSADQVLFAPGGDVQETGAANFILLNDQRVLTKPLDPSFLPGVTRDSVLAIARDLGYDVVERNFTIDEMLEFAEDGEAALSGTAAVLAGIGTILHAGREHRVGDGEVGPNTLRLRAALTELQTGATPDVHGWIKVV
ncbi:MAG: branched-chain amino acid aminotransferase [Acidimicrobiia bacterium]|nr:branched-chain amino acid aminotransferase [Acidimicrobiia bacterium]